MTEREWREASDLRLSAGTVLLVLVTGALLRFWALGHGIPYAVGADEPVIPSIALRMMRTGDFNPQFFDYPTFYIYVQLAVACARFVWGALGGLWVSLDQVSEADFYLWGRAVTATLGSATVLLVYRIGARWGARHALLAAALMAVLPPHVRESHYVLTDVPVTFLTALTFLLALRAHETATTRAFFWAGVAAGLAAATKYNAGLVLILPFLAAWFTTAGPPRMMLVLSALGGCGVAFLAGAPYTLLDLPGFLNGFGYLARCYVPRDPGAEPGWLVYLKHIRLAVGWPGMIVLTASLGFAAARATQGPGRARWTLLLAFPFTYFAAIADRQLLFGRYLLPIYPFVCILIGTAVVSGVSLLRRFDIPRAPRTALIAALTIAILLPPALQAIGFDRMIGRRTTQSAAYEWIQRHVPPSSSIVVEGWVVRLPSPPYRPSFIRSLTEWSWDDFLGGGHEYVVATSEQFGRALAQPERHPTAFAAYRQIFDQTTEVFRVEPSNQLVGPEIRVFKIQR